MSEIQELEELGAQLGLDWMASVDESLLDPSLVAALPVDWARNQVLLPVRQGEHIGVLTCDPMRLTSIDDLALLLGAELKPILAPRGEILKAIEKCYFRKQDTSRDFISALPPESAAEERTPRRSEDLLRMADQAPVTQLVNLILLEAVKQRASDVHIEPYENHLRIRYRIDGFLYEQASPPKHLEAALISRLKVMARLDIAEKRLPQDGMAKVRVGEREIDIRVSTIPVAEGERVVLRLLNRESTLLPLTDLGMPDDVRVRFQGLLREPHGVVLVNGPTGSGKTTTLYAALQQLDTQHTNVLTIEDPIEYQLPNIGQMQVKPKIGLTFAQGLRHILRQDPDVIFVGEIRDAETAEIAIRASLTGHVVFSTLHTNDAVSALIRMADMGIEPYLLAAALRGSLAQRLVRKLCPACRRLAAADGLPPEIVKRLPRGQVWTAVGCAECLGGYRGRTGLYELMIVDAEIQEAVRRGAGSAVIRRLALERGMKSLLDQGLALAASGETSVAEVVRVIGLSAAAVAP